MSDSINMRNTVPNIIILIVAILLHGTNGYGQTVSATLKPTTIVLGEHTSLTLYTVADKSDFIRNWPNYPDTFNHIEIIKRGNIDSNIVGNNKRYSQVILLTSFDSGSWIIPTVPYSIGQVNGKTAEISLSVNPVQLEGTDYNDIKEIIEVPAPGIDWLFWILVTIGVLIPIVLLFIWWKNRKNKDVPTSKKPTEPPYEWAMNQLKILEEANLPMQGEMKQYYIRLYNIYRHYLSATSGKRILQSSTDDILITIRHQMNAEDFTNISVVLRIADAVKFAKYGSSVTEANDSFRIISTGIIRMNNIKS